MKIPKPILEASLFLTEVGGRRIQLSYLKNRIKKSYDFLIEMEANVFELIAYIQEYNIDIT